MFKLSFILIALLLFPVMAFAQDLDLTLTATAAEELANQLVAAAEAGQWALAIGAGLNLLVHLCRKMGLLKFLPEKHHKLATAGLSVLASVGAGLLAGATLPSIALSAITVGVGAMFTEKALGKKKL